MEVGLISYCFQLLEEIAAWAHNTIGTAIWGSVLYRNWNAHVTFCGGFSPGVFGIPYIYVDTLCHIYFISHPPLHDPYLRVLLVWILDHGRRDASKHCNALKNSENSDV